MPRPAVKATWTILGQQVPTFARDLAGSNPLGRFSMDKWDGYTAARQRLFNRLRETKAPNPVVLSGDVHVHYFGACALSFADAVALADGDVMHVHFDGFGRPLRNPLRVDSAPNELVTVRSLA